MKRGLCLLMALLMALGAVSASAEEAAAEREDILSAANDFFAVARDAVSATAEDAWNDTSEFAADAWKETSDSISKAWHDAGELAADAWREAGEFATATWNEVGSFLGERRDELNAWLSVTGNDALEKLKEAFDALSAELQIQAARANELWLEIMDYAEQHGIAKVTQAKLTLAAMRYAQEDAPEGDIAQTTLDMMLDGGISDQASADAALSRLNPAKSPDPNEPRYYLGETVNAGKDTGYSARGKIDIDDPHFGWKLGSFFVSGYTSVSEDENGDPIFIKTLGDQIELWYQLEQDIDCLNGSDDLRIAEDKNGYDEAFGISKTNLGRGALITRHTDYRNAVGTPVLYTDYLSGIVASGADTTVQLFEEGDYEVALDYEIKDQALKLISRYDNYRVDFKFSVRNGNCMVYPFDVLTGAELTNTAVTESGFYLDLARSRYLDINIRRDVLSEGATGLTEDVRFNRPARDGDRYTDEGIYTITVSNRYTKQQTTKQIYVGTNKLLLAHMVTGLSVEEIRAQIAKGAQIAEDGTLVGAGN